MKSSAHKIEQIRSNSPAITEVPCAVLAELKKRGYSEGSIFAVHIALSEALTNAAHHGNGLDARKKVKLEYFIDSHKVEISVTDEGNGFDPNTVPDPRYGENLYKTNGRGLLLMHSFMDSVSFNQRGNTVSMVRYKNTKKAEK